MTTVCASREEGAMAADSKCTDGAIWFPMIKVHYIGDDIVGLAGETPGMASFLAWWKGGRVGPRPDVADCSALVLSKDGLWLWSSEGEGMLLDRDYHAIGSGAAAALGAMYAGASVRGAVEAACSVDVNSGGEIISCKLESA